MDVQLLCSLKVWVWISSLDIMLFKQIVAGVHCHVERGVELDMLLTQYSIDSLSAPDSTCLKG